jgi:pheromone shutdown protein TraB
MRGMLLGVVKFCYNFCYPVEDNSKSFAAPSIRVWILIGSSSGMIVMFGAFLASLFFETAAVGFFSCFVTCLVLLVVVGVTAGYPISYSCG